MIKNISFTIFGYNITAYYDEESMDFDHVYTLHSDREDFDGTEFNIQGFKENVERKINRKIVSMDTMVNSEDHTVFYNLYTEPKENS